MSTPPPTGHAGPQQPDPQWHTPPEQPPQQQPYPQQGAPQQNWGAPPTWQQNRGPIDPGAGGDDRTLAVLAHLSPIIAALVSAGSLSFLGPLILWLIYKDRSPLVRTASASSFNFHITVWLATIVGIIMCVTVVLLPVGIILIAGAWVAQLVLSIIGATRAYNSELYQYPYQVPILSS